MKASTIRNPRDISHKVNLKPNIKTSQFGTEHKHRIETSRGGTENYAMAIRTKTSPFGSERNHYKPGSLSGTEQMNICTSLQQHQSVQPVQHHSAKNHTMILPVVKVTTSTNPCGRDILRTQVADSTPPAATYLHTEDAMNDILDIVGDHQYIDDIAGTSIPVQIKS